MALVCLLMCSVRYKGIFSPRKPSIGGGEAYRKEEITEESVGKLRSAKGLWGSARGNVKDQNPQSRH